MQPVSQDTAHDTEPQSLPKYSSILLAVDSSDHSNRGTLEAVELATQFGSQITAAHVYAAKLHDMRFRQMEGGLPEQFKEEQELERQRDVHDDLITKGLSIITDSYLDQVDHAATKHALEIQRCSLEGKNYREIVKETNSGNYDLLVMGALGLGAVKGSRLGTVCQRTCRRSNIDTLVIKQPTHKLADGPIVVGVDGSTKSYGGLLTALSLAKVWDVPIKVISAFDPYYHYVAFSRIAGVLSEEAGQVFKFQEQEKLHEEIIDSGLAKIYQGHLSVAHSIAADFGVEVETVLLDGKPHEVMTRYLNDVKPSLLIIGTTGIHADAELDIGGNSEYLLSDAPCSVLLSHREHKPQIDRLASVTTSWTNEAEKRMEKVPSFVRPMAKMAILRYAQEKGHTVITEGIVDEATAQLMPDHAVKAMEVIVDAYDKGQLKRKPDADMAMRWSDAATKLLLSVKDLSVRGNLSMRAEKKARSVGSNTVEDEHIRPFIDKGRGVDVETPSDSLHWQASALARLMRVPEGFMRDRSKQHIEDFARTEGHSEVSLAVAEAGLAQARAAMENTMRQGNNGHHTMAKPEQSRASGCPFGHMGTAATGQNKAVPPLQWETDAESMLKQVPAGFCRDMTRKAAETIAERNSIGTISSKFVQQVMQTFQAGSETSQPTMEWQSAAMERISQAPDMVRGMLIKEIEGWSQKEGLEQVTEQAIDAIKEVWAKRGVFHLDPNDPRSG
ncbi:MAG: universal stress protein [Gammaproteobacteria bacterium]|nr:universal stress protein [Gammaproteobacteria bacterium]